MCNTMLFKASHHRLLASCALTDPVGVWISGNGAMEIEVVRSAWFAVTCTQEYPTRSSNYLLEPSCRRNHTNCPRVGNACMPDTVGTAGKA